MTIHPLVEQQMMLADEGNENLTGINETRFALWTRQVWLSSGSSAPQLSDECALARGGHPIWTVAHKWKGECTEEGIDIYDDFEVSERRIGRFCGKTVPLPIITSGPNLHFTAYTKSIFRGRGFLAHYSAGFTDDVTLMAELNHSLHEDPEGIIRLKPYDGLGVGEIKTGTITLPNDQRMIFYFETFQLRAPSKYDICTDEYFELYDGPSRFYPVIGKYCGSDIPPMVVSTAYALSYRVRIRSNSSHVVMFYKPGELDVDA
ncbi:cubilin [Clonorchis sinensis]|uniref:Cubilin n=1 Tax=Clonorchis sinensis TaxID=79923 RepID=G7YKX8_CLOSI|nr:cubilin [Clonorchis sinensis]